MNFLEWFFNGTISYDWAALLIRLVIGLALLPYGLIKISERHKPPQFPAVLGFSSKQSFYLAMVVETAASLCMLGGFFTRFMACAGIVNMSMAYKVAHGRFGSANALPFLLGFIAILFIGPGKISLDWLFF